MCEIVGYRIRSGLQYDTGAVAVAEEISMFLVKIVFSMSKILVGLCKNYAHDAGIKTNCFLASPLQRS